MEKKSVRYYNMDVVRYYLAMSVIIAHMNTLTGFELYWPTPGTIRVGAFFTISGFLVYPNFFKKKSIGEFFKTRAYRILPPYLVVITVFALAFCLISTLSPGAYFTSSQFWKYIMWNFLTLNFLCPDLPGVFQGAEFVEPAVNGSLWTMKVEWMMYFSVPLVAWLHRKMNENYNWLLVSIIALSLIYRLYCDYKLRTTGLDIYSTLDRQLFGQMTYFYAGALIYFNKEWFLKYKWPILAIALAVWFSGEYIPYYVLLLKPLVVSTVVIWVCIVGNWGAKISRHDNVSYDLYLYHFPLIQLGIFLGLRQWPLWLATVYVFSTTTLCAILSWNLIGKHFKRLLRPKAVNS